MRDVVLLMSLLWWSGVELPIRSMSQPSIMMPHPLEKQQVIKTKQVI